MAEYTKTWYNKILWIYPPHSTRVVYEIGCQSDNWSGKRSTTYNGSYWQESVKQVYNYKGQDFYYFPIYGQTTNFNNSFQAFNGIAFIRKDLLDYTKKDNWFVKEIVIGTTGNDDWIKSDFTEAGENQLKTVRYPYNDIYNFNVWNSVMTVNNVKNATTSVLNAMKNRTDFIDFLDNQTFESVKTLTFTNQANMTYYIKQVLTYNENGNVVNYVTEPV